MSNAKGIIVLARKIVPNYWEVKCVDSFTKIPVEQTVWNAIPHSADMSLGQIKGRLPGATVIDVTAHFQE